MSRNLFVSGQWNATCQSCGRKFKSGELRKRWDGLYVCNEDWETRHPQDFLRVKQDRQTVPWATPPESTPYFVPLGLLYDNTVYVVDSFVAQKVNYYLYDTATIYDSITVQYSIIYEINGASINDTAIG